MHTLCTIAFIRAITERSHKNDFIPYVGPKFVINNQNDCSSCDSCVGFFTAANNCYNYPRNITSCT